MKAFRTGALALMCVLGFVACGKSGGAAGSAGSADPDSDVGKLEALRVRMCACADQACVDTAAAETAAIMLGAADKVGSKDAAKTAEGAAALVPLENVAKEIRTCRHDREAALRPAK
jgi:hypothetical protein